MDFKKLTRDKSAVWGTMHRDLNTISTRKGCKIYIPTSYEDRGLADFGEDTYILGVYAIVVDDYYAISKAQCMLRITPAIVNTVKTAGGDTMFEFYFEPGSVVFPDTRVIKDNLLNYYMYRHFNSRGNVPEFFNLIDLDTLFDDAPHYTGAIVSPTFTAYSLIASRVARTKTDIQKDARHELQTQEDLLSMDYQYIPFDTPTYTATNTSARLLGPYIEDSITNALINPSRRPEYLENLLRS